MVFYEGDICLGVASLRPLNDERSLLEQRTVALAGVAQAHALWIWPRRPVAGPCPCGGLDTLLFSFDPEGVETVFGTPQGIRLGLEQLSACLGLSQDEASADTLRYTLAILQLERRFAGRDDLQALFIHDSSTQPTKQKISPMISMV